MNTFGKTLNQIIIDRGIGSDELLARKAMRLQDHQQRRINVQRKTINNWRNDRSMPRSAADRQFQLILAALEVTEKELADLTSFLGSEKKRSKGFLDRFKASPILRPMGYIFGACALVLVGSLNFSNWLSGKPSNSYIVKIPTSELTLSKDGYVIPSSNTKPVTSVLLKNLSGWDLYVARNEIYARRGWSFTRASSTCLQNHFNSWLKSDKNPDGWYRISSQRGQTSNLENLNIETIRAYECGVRGGQFKCNGHLNQCE